jgi:hypothetical protein
MSAGWLLDARLAGVALGFPLVAFAFGWSVLGRFTGLDREERFAACWGVSFAVLAVQQFLAFVLHADQALCGAVTIALMLLATGLCRLGRDCDLAPDDAVPWPLAGLWALAYLHLLCIQALLPVYRGSDWYFDWGMHYDVSLIFAGDRDVHTAWAGYTLASRTPLFNLVAATVLSLAGRDFSVFQTASVLTDCCIILPVYLLLRELFGPRAARLGLLLAPLNLWLLHNAWFTWSKMLAGYYVLLGLYFYGRSVRLRPDQPRQGSRLFLGSGVSFLLGFMTHQVALVYAAPLLLHAACLAVRRGTYRAVLRDLAVLALPAGLTAGVWYGWLAGTLGTEAILGTTPVTQGDTSAVFRLGAVAEWVSLNLAASVFPALLLGFWLYYPFSFTVIYRGLTDFYFSLFTGALTASLTFYLVGQFLRRLGRWGALALCFALIAGGLTAYLTVVQDQSWVLLLAQGLTVFLIGLLVAIALHRLGRPAVAAWRGSPVWAAVWLFLVLGTLGAAVLHPGKILHGIAHAACFPSAVLLAALGWGVLSRASRRWAAVTCAGMVAEFLLMFWSHWWLLTRLPEVLEELPGNEAYKDETVVFLNDRLGAGQYAFLAGAVVIQLLLVALLGRFLREKGP